MLVTEEANEYQKLISSEPPYSFKHFHTHHTFQNPASAQKFYLKIDHVVLILTKCCP